MINYPPASHVTPDNITELKSGEIFVFGSNLAGRHGRGAALTAKQRFGAAEGVGEGLTGRWYALPTVASPRRSLPGGLDDVRAAVSRFIDFAEDQGDVVRFNIFSGSTDGNGLAAALTNPTTLSRRKGTVKQDYPVYFEGFEYQDAEYAYLHLSRRNASALCDHDDLMTRIIVAKLSQHPRLGEAVRQRGGVAWLERCEHFTGARSALQGMGRVRSGVEVHPQPDRRV